MRALSGGITGRDVSPAQAYLIVELGGRAPPARSTRRSLHAVHKWGPLNLVVSRAVKGLGPDYTLVSIRAPKG